MVVIPTFNERDNLRPMVENVFGQALDLGITIVDDNSPDGTGALADSLAKEFSRIHVIHREKKLGLGTAYAEGFNYALTTDAELIFEMDADLSHDPAYLPEFIRWSKKYDLVMGSRYINGVRVEGWRFRRLLMSKLANIYISYLMLIPVWDCTTGYRCYHRRVLESVDLDALHSEGYSFQIEMTHHAYVNGFAIREIPVIFREREGGYSKISRRDVREAFFLVLKLHAPFKEMLHHTVYLKRNYKEYVEAYYRKVEAQRNNKEGEPEGRDRIAHLQHRHHGL
jgi:dolichol-phosphate mannosyltransferase